MFFCLFSSTSYSQENKFKLIIDPGHGGNDVGANKNKIKESELVLTLSKKIQDLLQKSDIDIDVSLTRTTNSYLSLSDRIQHPPVDLFLSLHANSSISSRVQGMETYLQTDLRNEILVKSKNTVDAIVKDLESTGKTQHSLEFAKGLQSNWAYSPSVIRRFPFYVVEKTKSPALLVEIGFLTNSDEAKKLATEDYQNTIAETIVKTIIDYKKSNQ
jgi:N-acetylmuramoyl-L-alanine amidase